MPALRLSPGLAVADRHDPQHGDAGHAPRLVEGAARGAIDQPLIGHVLEQRLQHDLVMAAEAEGARDLALACRLAGLLNEVEDLLAGRKSLGGFARHEVPNWALPSPPTMPHGGPNDARARR